jgi:hypothetical protein
VFLILIGCFATLEGMKIKSAAPMHHLMIMVSSVLAVAEGRTEVQVAVIVRKGFGLTCTWH